MKEYKILDVKSSWEDTENALNVLGMKGWKLITSYAKGYWLILEREKVEKEK